MPKKFFEARVDLKDLQEIKDKLENESGKILQAAYWEMYNTVNDEIVPFAKRICPVGHSYPGHEAGALRESIRAEAVGPFKKGSKMKEWTVELVAGNEQVDYAAAVEFGEWELTMKQIRAIAKKKGGIIPTGLTVPRTMRGKLFMTRARNLMISIVLNRMEKKIKEVTR